MIPDLARWAGYVKSNTVVIEESPLQREIRGRFAFAAALVVGSSPAPSAEGPRG